MRTREGPGGFPGSDIRWAVRSGHHWYQARRQTLRGRHGRVSRPGERCSYHDRRLMRLTTILAGAGIILAAGALIAGTSWIRAPSPAVIAHATPVATVEVE